MMNVDIVDDLRQAVVVARNEITKFIRGRKILILGILLIAILSMYSVIPYAFGDGYDDSESVASSFMSFYTLILELSVVLFAAPALVSEFEDRTALVLFTKPVRKWSIFVGKFMASMAIVIVFLAIYLLYTVGFSFATQGEVTSGFGKCFAMSIGGVFGATGLAMLLSAYAKKSSTATILTLITLILILDLVASLLYLSAEIETWWCLTDAIGSCVTGVWGGSYGIDPYTTSELWRSAGVMIAWGIITSIIAFFMFKKRDF